MKWTAITLLVLVAVWAAWDWVVVPLMGVGRTTPRQLRRMMDAGEAPVLLDVRTPVEYRWFRLPGSVNRPWPVDPAGLDIPKDAPIVVICMTGHRSPLAARVLQRAGFAHVSNLTWGASAWALLGNPVEKGEPGKQ